MLVKYFSFGQTFQWNYLPNHHFGYQFVRFPGCIFMVGSKIPLIHRSRSWFVICLQGGSLLVINGVLALYLQLGLLPQFAHL